LTNLENFLLSQQSTWIKKSLISTNDNWQLRLREKTENFTNFMYRQDVKTPIDTIINAGYRCIKSFTLLENNFLSERVLNNENFG
jgi:hypothetical protein